MADLVLPESLNLPFAGADSHAHLDSPKLWPDFDAVLERAARAGVARIGQVFLSHAAYAEKMPVMASKSAAASAPSGTTAVSAAPGASGRAGPSPLSANPAPRPELFFMLGIHPSDAHEAPEAEWPALREDFLRDDRLAAVGEIGLDFYWKECPPDVQDRAFRIQLRLAREADRPVVIHSRDAFAATMAVLDEEGFAGRPLLWHCFGGDTAMAGEILKRGWHISIPGPVTFPANQALREAVAHIPENRLLLETDCPYLAPQPWRGKRNEPALVAFTAQAVAQAKGMPLADLWSRCGENTIRFFGLV